MKKYVIYKVSDCSIIRLCDEQPSLQSLPGDQDFDTVANWMAEERFKIRIEKFLNK